MNLLQYPLSTRVSAFSTLREGGNSTGNYASFNINHYCGDDERSIAKNLTLLSETLGVPEERIVYPHQTHGTAFRHITTDFFTLAPSERKSYLEGVDAVLTDMTGVCIGVSTADCIPIVLYDPVHHCAAAVHAGWRGTVARIVQVVVREMVSRFGSSPYQLRTSIGPGISLEAFEVGDEVYSAFAEAAFPMHEIARRFPVLSRQPSDSGAPSEKWHIDLPQCNRLQLLECGVPDANIHLSCICTYAQSDRFFSARRLGVASGRIFTGIVLR